MIIFPLLRTMRQASLFCSLLLLAGCGGSDSGADHVKEPTRGTTNSPQAHKTGPSTDPGIPGMNMIEAPFGFTEGGSSQIQAQSLSIVLADGQITMPKSVRAGHLTLNLVNKGSSPQTFRLEGGNMNVAPPTALDPGKTYSLTAALPRGRYRVTSSADVDGENRELESALVVTD